MRKMADKVGTWTCRHSPAGVKPGKVQVMKAIAPGNPKSWIPSHSSLYFARSPGGSDG